ncbi:MAG: PorT family protein [Bacteroidales bacterium]|nr:PorT family protein [Bacteroidales bacterium]
MKKIFALLSTLAVLSLTAGAQPYYGGRGPVGGPGRYNSFGGPGRYDRGGFGPGRFYNDWYGGIKFGVVGSHVSSESEELDGRGVQTGISAGLALGFNMTPDVAFESGLYYVEKGGSSRNSGGKFTYGLDYLEIPLVLKYYVFSPGRRAVFQPYVGAYLGFGVGGEIKDYGNREAFSSFDNGYFRRGDSGLAFGCGVSYSFLYASVGYEFGLANIGQDLFNETRNRALVFSVGFAF